MHTDYRFYVKFRNGELWEKWLEAIEIEATNCEVYSLSEIANVHRSPALFVEQMNQPIGLIFEAVISTKKGSYCFIHDYKKSVGFFERLTDYLFGEIIKIAENDAVIIADLTDFDTDDMGDHITYYLGGGKDNIRSCVVEGPDGLCHHDIVIADFEKILKYEDLSDAQKGKIKELTGGVIPKALSYSF